MANKSNPRTEPKEIMGLHRITKKRLLELCKKDKLYQTPSLNDVLYLHYQGFQCIEGLEDYTELKCLWLECNAISQIQGLENQTKLKCLFLQSNLIKKIENLQFCKELDTINLSQNHIRKIENCGVDVLPVLNTLNISSNYLNDCEGLRELENCRNVSVLDLSNNRIDDILVVKIFSKMPELKVLVLQGNPVVSKIPQYRKTLILECKNLTYLDSRPVFPKDRACAEAWKRGGYEEERKESERWNQKERRKMRDSVNATIRMRNKFRKPEDHLSLLVSSDSEDDTSKKKRTKRQQQVLDAGVDMELDIWDEVAGGDETKSETASSSGMNVSSSTSVISTTDSNEQSSSFETKCHETQEICKYGEENIRNVNARESLINQSQKGEEAKEPERQDIGKNDSERKDSKVSETKVDTKVIDIRNQEDPIVEIHEELNVKYTTSDDEYVKNLFEDTAVAGDENQAAYEKHTKGKEGYADTAVAGDEDHAPYERHTTGKKVPHTPEFTSDNEDTPNDSYNDTIKAIHRVSMNDLSQTVGIPERRVQLQIETDEDNYEPFKEMDEAMKTMIKQDDVVSDKARELNSEFGQSHTLEKNQTQIEYDNECSLVTNQMKKDFEQISTNMDMFMVQLQRDQEERNEALAALFTEKEDTTEISSDSSGNDGDVALSLYRMVDQWDRDTRMKGDTAKLLVNTSGGRLVDHGKMNAKGTIVRPGKQASEENKKSRSKIQIMTPEADKSFYELEKDIKCKENKVENISKELEKKETIRIFNEKAVEKPIVCENPVNEQIESSAAPSDIISCNDKAEHDCDVGAPEVYPNRAVAKPIVAACEKSENEEIESSAAPCDIISCNDKAEHDCDVGAPEVYPNRAVETSIVAACENPQNKYIENSTTTGDTKDKDENFKDQFGCDQKQAEKVINKFADLSMERKCKSKMSGECVSVDEGRLKNILNRDDNFEYKPLDISMLTRASNQALNSFEKEAKELKDLLQKLENENDQLFRKLNAETKCEADETTKDCSEKDLKESVKIKPEQENVNRQNDDVPSEENEKICDETVEGIIESLDLRPNESDEDFTDSQTEKAADDTKLPLSNTIRGVISSLTEIFKNENFPKCQLMPKQRSVATTSSEKSASLKNLAAQPNLNIFNKDTHQSLDNLLNEYQKEQSLEIRQMVDRVYAQRDRYNDTIELIDGKLMVIDKATGKLKELPKPAHYSSDSDADYDTAQSEDEGACCNIPRVRNREVHYRPTERRSNEQLIHQALGERCQRNYPEEDEDSDNEEFYSMDPLMKPNIYGKIDKEFFDRLSLDHLKFSQQDEDHVVQCARSYEELKSVLSLSKHERCVILEENDLLQKMTEREAHKREQQPGYNEEPTKDELLRKMISRTKKKNWVKKDQSEGEIERTPYRPPNEPIQIFEYNIETIKDLHYDPGEYQVTLKDIDNNTTDIYGHDVYNFIHDDSLEVNKEEIFSSRNKATKTINDNFKRIDGQEGSTDVGAEKSAESLWALAKLSEEEKNELENNTDVDGIIKKLELQFENGCKDEREGNSKVNETSEKNNLKLKLENIKQITDKLPCKNSAQGIKNFAESDPSLSKKYECENRSQVIMPPSSLDCKGSVVIENQMISLNSENVGYPKANEHSEDTSVQFRSPSQLLNCDLTEIKLKTYTTAELLQEKQFSTSVLENNESNDDIYRQLHDVSGNSKFVDSNFIRTTKFVKGNHQESVYSDQPLQGEPSSLPEDIEKQSRKDGNDDNCHNLYENSRCLYSTVAETKKSCAEGNSQEILSQKLSTAELTHAEHTTKKIVCPDSNLHNSQNISQKSQYLKTTSSLRKGSGGETLEEYKSQKYLSSDLLPIEPFPSSELEKSANDDNSQNFLENIDFLNSYQWISGGTADPSKSPSLQDPELLPQKHFPSTTQCLPHPEYREEKRVPANELNSVFTNRYDHVPETLGVVQKPVISYDNTKFRETETNVSHNRNLGSSTKPDPATNIADSSKAKSQPTHKPGSNEYNSPMKSSPDQKPDTETLTTMPDVDILECNLEIFDCNEDVIDTITVNAELHYDFENL